MDNLVDILTKIDMSDLPDIEYGYDHILKHADHDLIPIAEEAASDLLITGEGVPDFTLIDALYHDHGYFIFPGERDRAGWITACLQTKKGIIVFG